MRSEIKCLPSYCGHFSEFGLLSRLSFSSSFPCSRTFSLFAFSFHTRALVFNGTIVLGCFIALSVIFGGLRYCVDRSSRLDWEVQKVIANFSSSELSSHQKAI